MASAIGRVDVRRVVKSDVTEAYPLLPGRRRRPRASSLAPTSPFRKPAAPRPSGGTFGPYVVHEQIGEGGMASVHRAELPGALGFRKVVALKRLHTALTGDAELLDAFVHEAQLASRLRHSHIAEAYDLGKIDGTYYIAMEYVPGPTLSEVMAQARRAAGPVPLPIALEVLIQLLDALEHAHELCDDGGRPLDLIHRDVSPGNVIVSSSGAVKLIDFGIAKDRSARRPPTEAGVIKGKHAYIAPEYTYGQLDRRADLFGVGVIAHELLTGRRLFLGATEIESLRNVREKTVAPPSRYRAGIPGDLDDIVLTALQRDPRARWQNAGAMRVALTAVARTLGRAPSGRHIRDWIEWAFQQQQRDELTEEIDPAESLSISIEVQPEPPAQAVATMPRAPTVVARRGRPRAVRVTEQPMFAAMLARKRTPIWIWLAMLVVAAAAAALCLTA